MHAHSPGPRLISTPTPTPPHHLLPCQVTGGSWKQCTPLGPSPGNTSSEPAPSGQSQEEQAVEAAGRPSITLPDGNVCSLPLTYNGAEVDGCVSIAGA